MNSKERVRAVMQHQKPDWFDYSVIKEQCERYPDKAIITGHEGSFQIVTNIIQMDRFFMLMIDEPEVAKRILERINEFEMEFYKRWQVRCIWTLIR